MAELQVGQASGGGLTPWERVKTVKRTVADDMACVYIQYTHTHILDWNVLNCSWMKNFNDHFNIPY